MKSIDLCDIGQRIARIRKQSGLLQPDFARKYGVSRNTQIEYEKGRTSPSGEYLAKMAMDGVDVQALLIGEAIDPYVAEQRDRYNDAGPIDMELLEIAIEAADMCIESRKVDLTPQKHAKLISLIYELYMDEDKPQVNTAQIIRLVDLAS